MEYLAEFVHFGGGGKIIINLIASEISWKFNGVQPRAEKAFFIESEPARRHMRRYN